MKDSLMLGILFDVFRGLVEAADCVSAALPVRKEAAIAVKPVGCGLIEAAAVVVVVEGGGLLGDKNEP